MKLKEIVVEEIISDASIFTKENIAKMASKVTNKRQFCDEPPDQNDETEDPIYFLRAPRNSVIGRDKSSCKDQKPSDGAYLKVYYPFFSSHLTLPVKPGETVWATELGDTSYWVTRVHEPIHVEDINYTHTDRKNIPVSQPPIITPEDGEKIIEANDDNKIDRIPKFNDGLSFETRDNDKRDQTEDDVLASKPDKRTFQRSEEAVPGNTHYESIYLNNNESGRLVYEPVPTLTQRPGDLVLQGSNNTTIILGTDRGYTHSLRPDGTSTNSSPPEGMMLKERAGSIDIIAGRGRIPESEASDGLNSFDDKDVLTGTTRPRIIKNIREAFERDKNIGLDKQKAPDGGHLVNVSEGDPDFLHDASRVYITMNSNPDELLGLSGNLPQSVDAGDLSNVGTTVTPVVNKAAVIVKSDEVRIVARQEPVGSTAENNEINGSIKIVKEGIADSREGNGRAVIMIQPDGTIVIDGPKIVVGSGASVESDGNGGGSQLSLGIGASEPIVLGDQLLKILSAIINVLDSHIHPTGAGPSGPRQPGMGGEVPTGTWVGTASVADEVKNLNHMLSKLGKTL